MNETNIWTPDFDAIASTRNAYADAKNLSPVGNMSDGAANLMYNLIAMQQQYGLDDQWWNDHDSPNAIYTQLRSLGFSDAYISQYLLGNGSRSQMQSSPQVSGGTSNGALDSAVGALNAMNGSVDAVSKAVQADTAAQVGQAQVKALDSEANLNAVNAGLRPVESAASVAESESNVERNKHLNELTDAEIPLMAAKVGCTEAEARYFNAHAYYYEGITPAAIREMESQFTLNHAKAVEALKNTEVMQADIDLKEQLEKESTSRTVGNIQDNITKGVQAKFSLIDMANYNKSGVRLDVDTQSQYIQLMNKGEYDKAFKLVTGQYKWLLYSANAQYRAPYVMPDDEMITEPDGKTPGTHYYQYIRNGAQDLLNGVGVVITPNKMGNPMRGAKTVVNSGSVKNVSVPKPSSDARFVGDVVNRSGRKYKHFIMGNGQDYYEPVE